MSGLPQTVDDYLNFIELVTGSRYNEEQREVVRNYKNNVIVFADPGTGKTHTVLALVLAMIQMGRIPSSKIRAMSFTKEATAEMSMRYESLCEKLRIRTNLKFSTIHSLSLSILDKNPQGFGKTAISVNDNDSFYDRVELISALVKDSGLDLSNTQINKITAAIKSLNSSFKFDRKSVENRMAFKEIGVSFEDFTMIRQLYYRYGRRSGKPMRGDLCMYALDLLINNPDIQKKMQEETDVLIIDEGQDLSIIQLKMFSLITKKLIIVGDMKQQINIFAGACPEIVDWYYTFFPDAVDCKLVQTYRCAQKIVEFAKPIILPNDIGGEDFVGLDKEADVTIKEGADVTYILDDIAESIEIGEGMPYQMAFLYRNNSQEVLLADEIWKRRIPSYIPKHINALKVPIIEDLVALTDLALNPRSLDKLDILIKLVPAFKKYKKVAELPIYKIMTETGFDFFSVNYDYEDNGLVHGLISRMQEINDKDGEKGFITGKAFNMIYPYYTELFLKGNAFKMEFEPAYYTDLVKDMVNTKTFRKFKQDEIDKAEYFEKQLEGFTSGIKCFTMHTSKGKESDRVCIIEANDVLLPQVKKFDRLIKANCLEEAAEMIRGERALLFVASTRARNDLTVMYRGELSNLFNTDESYNKYQALDEYYSKKREPSNDLGAFIDFVDSVVASMTV